jgi:riboflavin kinase/FMN adenylyltransferase
MKVHRDLRDLPQFNNAVITIGSFDGVHLGHQELIDELKLLAQKHRGESVLITFHPHPRSVVFPSDTSLKLITSIEEKIALIDRYQVDHLVIVPFTVEFSQLSADEYIEKFLVQKFNPRCIVIGYDHHFGLNRQGDISFLRWHSQRFGYEVVEIEQKRVEDMAVSSTKIRRALETAQMREAAKWMGHHFPLSGKVVKGRQIGRTINYPTANLEPSDKHKLIPPDGIYAVLAHLGQESFRGMLYIGTRPTLPPPNNRSIEVNLFDFDRDIYEQTLNLEIIDFIRGDQKFEGLEALQSQLGRDKVAAETILLQANEYQADAIWLHYPKVAVVILNYNGAQHLKTYLPSLLKSTYPNFDIIVADNDSSDDSVHFLEEYYPKIRLIELPENYGYAGGYNEALKQVSGAEYLVLLNSDIEVSPSWIEPIIHLMEQDQSIAAAQPKVLSYHERHQFEYAGASGGFMDALGYPFCRGRIFAETEKDQGQYEQTREIFWASGAAMFMRAALFQKMGGFDADYFAHAEEIDLCWRLKLAGYKVVARPQSVVYHLGGGTLAYNTPRKTYLNFRNSLFTILKNEDGTKLLWLLPLRLVLDGLAAFLFLSQGRFEHVGAIFRAHWHFFPKIGQTLKKRKANRTLIEQNRFGPPSKGGIYQGSIAFDYYGRGKDKFSEL